MVLHCEIGTESTWEAFVLQCNKNKENINPLSSDIKQQPVSRRRGIKLPNDDSRDDSPTRRESSMQYSSSTIMLQSLKVSTSAVRRVLHQLEPNSTTTAAVVAIRRKTDVNRQNG